MLSRQHLRVKAMQAIYSYSLNPDVDLKRLKSELNLRIQKSYELYFVFLTYILEVAQYAIIDAQKKRGKYLPSEADLNTSVTISNNPVINWIAENKQLRDTIDKKGTANHLSNKQVKKLYDKLLSKQKYKDYAALKNHTLADHKSVVKSLMKRVILENKELYDELDEYFTNLGDDHFLLSMQIQKQIDQFHLEATDNFQLDFKSLKDDCAFANDLAFHCIEHFEVFDKTIAPRLKNWDIDRIAQMDLILIKMAMSEFIHFPFIPIKVTINEYLDISKTYSTPKSREFINGILDRVMKQLKEEGKINKKGRGLVG